MGIVKRSGCEQPPLTNRGAQVTEAWFRGAEITEVHGHDLGQKSHYTRGYASHPVPLIRRLWVGLAA